MVDALTVFYCNYEHMHVWTNEYKVPAVGFPHLSIFVILLGMLCI